MNPYAKPIESTPVRYREVAERGPLDRPINFERETLGSDVEFCAIPGVLDGRLGGLCRFGVWGRLCFCGLGVGDIGTVIQLGEDLRVCDFGGIGKEWR